MKTLTHTTTNLYTKSISMNDWHLIPISIFALGLVATGNLTQTTPLIFIFSLVISGLIIRSKFIGINEKDQKHLNETYT